MIEKIITLVFGMMLLAVTVILSVETPSVENIVAVVCSAVIVVSSVVGIVRKDYVVLEEKPSKGSRMIDHAMKFQNELVKYIKFDKKRNRIVLKVKK